MSLERAKLAERTEPSAAIGAVMGGNGGRAKRVLKGYEHVSAPEPSAAKQ